MMLLRSEDERDLVVMRRAGAFMKGGGDTLWGMFIDMWSRGILN
jgi:hypothetical protein